MKNYLVKYWKSIVFIFFLCYLSFAPSSDFRSFPVFAGIDKVVHLFMYIFLAAVLVYDNREMIARKAVVKLIVYAFIFPVTLGGVIELIQENFFPPRSAEWFDWFMDIAGVLIGYFSATRWFNYRLNRKK